MAGSSQRHRGPRPPAFRFAESYELEVKEPSGLAYIAELDRFVAIDDSSRTLVMFELTKHKLKAKRLDSRPTRRTRSPTLKASPTIPNADGSSRSPSARVDFESSGFLAGRHKGKLVRSPSRSAKRDCQSSATTPTRKASKGWRSCPGRFSPDARSHLVAVNEAEPKVVLLIDPEALKIEHQLALPKKWDKAIGDLSDVGGRSAVRPPVPAERREPASARARVADEARQARSRPRCNASTSRRGTQARSRSLKASCSTTTATST